LSEQNGKDKMRDLAKFVDEKFKRSTYADIFNAFPQILVVIILLSLVFSFAISDLRSVPISQWTPTLISIAAIIIAYLSFIMASRKYANKRIAYREAKRLEKFLTDKSKEALCLLPSLVALKMENNPIKLQDLYEVNKELFTVNKLMEHYYFS
jgi:predicted histidine transporter YuiF (NhaC family)